jgi:Ca2+-binding RTX toxin-like protein
MRSKVRGWSAACAALLVALVASAAGSAGVAATTCNGLTATIVGTSGTDTLTGTAGNDVIAGLGGNDAIDGAGGDDVICGGAGDDGITGGAGTDTVSYAESATKVTVDLGTGTASGEGTDTLSGVENATGSALADTLTGSTAANVLRGGGGADVIDGAAGNDTIDGGASKDTASFASAAAGVNASLATGSATGDGSDSLNAVENLTGSPQGDTLTGNSAANVIDGGDGDDTMTGGGGADVVSFKSSAVAVTVDLTAGTASGAGSDTFSGFLNATGSAKNDTLIGTDGDNTLDGGNGTDTCQPKNGVDKGANCEIVTATIDVAGTADTYTFTGAAGKSAFVDDLTTDTPTCSTLVQSLAGPSGPVYGPAGVCTNHGPISLVKGTYTLTFGSAPSTTGTGTYKFRWWDVKPPQSFAYTLGSTVAKDSPKKGEGFVESPQAEDDYTFTGTAGQRVYYDYLNGGPTPNCNFHRVLLSPSSAIVPGTDGFVCTNLGPITLPASGTYTVRIFPNVNADDVGTYSFRITVVPPVPQTFAYTLGSTVAKDSPQAGEGFIEVPQAEDDYTFAGTTGQKIHYDNLPGGTAANCNFRRVLMSPSSTIVTGTDGFVCSDLGPITLPATGTYTLRIVPVVNADDVGTYSFRITQVPAPQSFAYTLGSTVAKDSPQTGEGFIESPQAEDDYTFTGTTGQKVYYDNLAGGPGANCNFRRVLMSPSSTVVPGTDGFVCGNLGPITLPANGTYTLRILPVVNADDVGTYSFKIVNVPAPQSFVYTLGTTVSKDSPQTGEGFVESQQAEDDYTFTGAAGQKVSYVTLPGGPQGNCNFKRQLIGPSSTVVTGTDGFVCGTFTQVTLPAAGTYTLRIYPSANADDVGTYSFKITTP